MKRSYCQAAMAVVLSALIGCSNDGAALKGTARMVDYNRTDAVIHEKGQPCSEDQIGAIETLMRVHFPDDYREFLKHCNGLTFDDDHPVRIKISDELSRKELDSTFGHLSALWAITDHDTGELRLHQRQNGYEYNRRVPSGFVAIGNGFSSARLCICMNKGSDYGKVYYWEPAEDWEMGDILRSSEDLRFVANSFAEFWQLIEADPEW